MYVRYSLEEGAKAPYIGSAGAGAMDLSANETVVIAPGQSVTVGTGVKFEIPEDYAGVVTMRSGMGFKKDLDCHDGLIDSDYRGEVKVRVRNLSNVPSVINQGDRFAQMRIVEVPYITLKEVDSLETTERGEGGFGSTGR